MRSSPRWRAPPHKQDFKPCWTEVFTNQETWKAVLAITLDGSAWLTWRQIVDKLPDHPPSVLVAIVVVISVVVVVIVVPIVLLAEFPCSAIVGVARENIARGGLRDQTVRVLLEEEARLHVARSRMPHHAVVPLLAAVALLDRATRIAARQPRGLGDGERNVAGGQVAFVALQRPARDRVPAGVGPQRRLQQDRSHAGDLVCRLVHPCGGRRDDLLYRRDAPWHPTPLVVFAGTPA